MASVFARHDPSEAVRAEAIRVLAWTGQYSEIAEILQSMSAPEFGTILKRVDLDDLPPEFHSQALSAYRTALADTSDPKARLQIVLTLIRLGDSDGLNQLKCELASMPASIVKELSDYSLRPAIDHLTKVDPEWVADRIVEGALWRDSWLSLVSTILESQRDILLQRVCSENLRYGGSGRIISLLAATSDPPFAKRVFDELCAHRRQLLEDPRNSDKQAIDQQLKSLFKSIPAQRVVEGLTDLLAKEPEGLELSIVIEMFSRMGSTEDSIRGALPDNIRQQLRRYLKAAVPGAIAEDDNRGQATALLATALSEVGDSDDIADLLGLIQADIERVRNGPAALARGDRLARGQGGMMSYSNWHVQALVWLDHVKAEPLLIDLLKEPEYELDAACALVTIAKNEAGNRPMVTGRFGVPSSDFRTLRKIPLEWSTIYNGARRIKFAAVLKEHISALLQQSKTGDHKKVSYNYRLKALAKPLAALDPTQSADLILEIAALPANFDGWRRIDLFEALLFGGVLLSADKVIGLLEPIFEQFRKQGVYSNDSLSLLNRILHLLPFVEPPARGIATIRDLSTEFRLHPHNHRDLLMALGQCECAEGLVFLRDLAKQSGAGFQHVAREWFEAVAACSLPEARTLLLSFVDPQLNGGVGDLDFPHHSADYLAALIANIVHTGTPVTARRFLSATEPNVAPARSVRVSLINQ